MAQGRESPSGAGGKVSRESPGGVGGGVGVGWEKQFKIQMHLQAFMVLGIRALRGLSLHQHPQP